MLRLYSAGREGVPPPCPALTTMLEGLATMAEQPLPATRWRGNCTEYLVTCALCGAQRYVRKGRENTPCRHCRADVTYPDKLASHPLYGVWKDMKKRCTNPRCKLWADYGGRGITLCDEWQSSKAFIEWAEAHGWKPGLEIERRDNDRGYSPDNSIFATRSAQMRNTRRTVLAAQDVARIKRLLREGVRAAAIASMFEVSGAVISNIKLGKNWGDVPPAEEA